MLKGALGTLLVFSIGLLAFPAVGVPYLCLLVGGGAAIYKLSGRGSPRDYLGRLDDLLFAGERAIVSASLLVSAITVFADVVWREARTMTPRSAAIYGGVFLLVCMIGAFTAKLEQASLKKRIAGGLAAFLIGLVLVGLIYLMPNGFGWSQKLALALMLWVGLLGASMCSKLGRHISVDAVRRLVPERFRRAHEIAALTVTVGLVLTLVTLSIEHVQQNWRDWIDSEMTGAIFESVGLPIWASTVAMVIGFALMGARFIAVMVTGSQEVDLLESLGAGKKEGDAP